MTCLHYRMSQKKPYMLIVLVERVLLERILWDSIRRLDKVGLLWLINMSHFGWPTEANACVKQLLACFMVAIYD